MVCSSPGRDEPEDEVPQRDGLGGLPTGGGEQRGPGDPAIGWIVPGRVDRQLVPVLEEISAHPQPVTLAGGQLSRGHRPRRRDRSDARIPSGSNSARSFLNSGSRGYISASASGGTRESLAR